MTNKLPVTGVLGLALFLGFAGRGPSAAEKAPAEKVSADKAAAEKKAGEKKDAAEKKAEPATK